MMICGLPLSRLLRLIERAQKRGHVVAVDRLDVPADRLKTLPASSLCVASAIASSVTSLES